MKKIVIDTNALLRYFLNDIPDQKELVFKILRQAQERKVHIHVPQIVIFELDFILSKYYHIAKDDIIATLQPLIATDYIEVESKAFFLAALILYKSAPVSFVDCFLVAAAKKKDAELFTFDQKLKKLSPLYFV